MSALKMWLSTLQTKRLKKAVFLHDEQTLKHYLATKNNAKQVILCGKLIYAGMDQSSAPNESEAIAQPKRLRDNRDYKGKKGNWYVWVASAVLNPSNGIKRNTIFIAQDQYIAYGQNETRGAAGRLLLVGGAVGKSETTLELYFFENGVLTSIEERMLNANIDSLAASGGMELLDLIEHRIEELTGGYSGELKIHIAAPLPEYPAITRVLTAINAMYVGNTPFERLIQPTLTVPQQVNDKTTAKHIKDWALPVVIALTGAAGGGYLANESMDNYNKSIKSFKRAQASQSPDVDNAQLGLLQAKGVFLDNLNKTQDYPYFADMTRILKVAGELQGVYISQVRLLGNPNSRSSSLKAAASRGQDGGVPDLQMVLHLPLPDGFNGSLRDHSRTALEGLTNRLHNQANAYRFTAYGHTQARLLDGKHYNAFELRVVKTIGLNVGDQD